VLARQLGARRVLVVHDGESGAGFAAYFRRAPGRLGLRVVDTARWNPHRLRLRPLAARARRSDPQAVFLCGLIDTSAGEVLALLRRALPPSVPLIACNGVLPVALLFKRAGPAARGTYVSLAGLANERLAPAGKAFVREFGATQPGGKVNVDAVYAGQAAKLLLDAIARSDGTRASVSSELFDARVRRGLLGSFAIDSNGDPTPAPIAIVRLERGGGANVVESYEGARVDRVIRPPRRLLGKSG
jgi:ABC-type branched-subunit amino acid transport system substrate-binding protein